MVGRDYGHGGMRWAGKDFGNDVFVEAFESDYNYVETIGMRMEEGRTTF